MVNPTKDTSQQKDNGDISTWRFRREITLPAILHLLVILIMLVAGWSNLQKDLALIQHDLDQLIHANVGLQERIEKLARRQQDHEYRLKTLERQWSGKMCVNNG